MSPRPRVHQHDASTGNTAMRLPARKRRANAPTRPETADPSAQRASRARAESLASETVIGRPARCRPITGVFW